MAVKNAIFLFEVVVDSVKTFVDTRVVVIRSDFANIFSLELKDPKSMHIVIPEPPPLPPEPVGKKGKKKKKPKPKKKGKKGKKGAIELPPPEPCIQVGQSILFPCSAEVLIQNMKKFPMEVSLWSKEENAVFIGASIIPWDPVFLTYLEKIADCKEPPPHPSVKDEYNVFQEGTAKLMAQLGIQVKLRYFTEKITSSFRTLTEDEAIRKVLYTGMNSKQTSFICNYKTTDEVFKENCNKVPNKYTKSIEATPATAKPMVYADYKNAPGANLSVPDNTGYCCFGLADKPPDDKYKSPETCPDIDFICDYVRKIITSCNDNMRMLTPRPTIRPRARATDVDRLCYCRETSWPPGNFAQRYRREVQAAPCPLCREAKATRDKLATHTFDIANIRGPCGQPDCKIARDLRAYIQRLFLEDNVEIDINDIIGPCGSKSCTLVEKIQDCIRKRGDFKQGSTLEGLSTQCACYEQMQKSLFKRTSCTSVCSKECSDSDSSASKCDGKGCPFKGPPNNSVQVYQVYYFTVEYEFETQNQNENQSENQSGKGSPSASGKDSPPQSGKSSPPSQSGKTSPTQSTPATQSVKTTPAQSEKATPAHSEKATPAQSEKATPAHSEKATPGHSEKATPGHSEKATPGHSEKASPAHSAKSSPAHSEKDSPTGSRATSPSPGTKSAKPFKHCDRTCPSRQPEPASCSRSVCSTITSTDKAKMDLKCVDPVCPSISSTIPPSPADSNIVVRLDDIRNPCCVKTCEVAEKVKDFIALGKTQRAKKLKDEDPCYCDCDCTFRLSNKTTYCAVCGGYEFRGDDMDEMPDYAKPHPCPVYHKLYDKRYIQVESPFPEMQEDKQQQAAEVASNKSTKTTASRLTTATIKQVPSPSEKEKRKVKKSSKKKKVGKFTATGSDSPAPQQESDQKEPDKKSVTKPYYYIAPVPRDMGWLWNAEDIPGLKPRPKWRPGATHKRLVRRYRAVREGADVREKKKQALLNRKKKIEMKPTLVVTKQDGEYTVKMEVFKKYSRERLPFQYPYDEKPPLVYTIGKTEEEKIKLQKQRDRRERRESRRKSRLIQSTFRDKCQEICLKAYNQAMGLLPLPNLNNPECPCDLKENQPLEPPIDSCSCSDEGTISTSDTDNDEWVIEFTPPMARWNPKARHEPNHADNETQYTYLDFRVKLVDKQGNPVPRFFKGPDGKEECSDLGGFWGPGHVWLEINKDGWIGQDGRWVPQSFVGPDGMFYLSEDGVFIDNTGTVWKIGVDGYIDKDSKWTFYPRSKVRESHSTATGMTDKKKAGHKTDAAKGKAHEKGNITTHKDGKGKHIAGTSHTAMKAGGKPDKKNTSVQVKSKHPVIMNVAVGFENRITPTDMRYGSRLPQDRSFLRSRSVQGNYRGRNANQTDHNRYIDSKLSKYREIMNGLLMYDDLCDPTVTAPVKPAAPFKANRAVNTPRRKISPFTMDGCCHTMPHRPSFISNVNETTASEASQGPLIV